MNFNVCVFKVLQCKVSISCISFSIVINDAKRRVYGENLAKKQKCSFRCSVLFSSRYIDEKKKLSSKICFRFRLIYISKFIGQYIYRNQSNLSYKKYSKNNLGDNTCGLAT